MNKEPLVLYLFRLLVWLGLLAFLVILYWSSALVEQDLKVLHSDNETIKTQLNHIQEELKSHPQQDTQPEEKEDKTLSLVDQSSSNLLSIDPFYQKTLPQLLGKNFKPHGIRKQATVGRPEHLHPFSNWSQVASWIDLCTITLATSKFGIYETFAPNMAIKMEIKKGKEGKPEYWLYLRKDVFWEPLKPGFFASDIHLAPQFLQQQPVTAHDFKFFFDAIMNSHVEEAQAVALRLYYSDVEEIEVIDDYTLVVRWKAELVKNEQGQEVPKMKYMAKTWTGALRPLASFVYKYFADGTKIVPDDQDPNTYRTNPIWAQNFSHHWAKNVILSCGPWTFDGMTEREIRFKRNANYYEPYATLVNALEIKFKDSPDTIWEDFKSGGLDTFQVPPNQIAELERFLEGEAYQAQAKQGLAIRRLDFVDRSYAYIGWNEARPLFKSKKVRQALTMAIDRQRIIQQNLNGMGIEITGPFFRYSPSYDSSIPAYPYDVQQARLLLAEEGWYDSDGDGIIDKVINGQHVPFQFTLTYYVKNPTTKSICDYIATALKEVGIVCQLNGVDIADLSALFDDKNFDAIFLAWALGSPPEDPKQIWYSKGAEQKGSSNAIGFTNPEIDRLIEQLEYEFDPQKRIELYHRFDRIIYEEAPYTFLYTPKVTMVYREYLQNVFIPAERQDLIPGANVAEPQPTIYWIKETNS